MQAQNRNLSFPNLLNVRDLGGCRTLNGRQTRSRSLLRADDLNRLTPAGAEALFDYGVRTLIDLRWPDDAETHPNLFHVQPHQLNHLQLSLLGTSYAYWRSIRPHKPKEEFNCIVLEYAKLETCAVLRAIAAAPEGGVLFHCVSGKDRTGFVAALLLALADVEPAAIVQDYGLSTENLRESYLAAYPDEREATLERVRCPPEQIINMLTHLHNHYGTVADYLLAIGLQPPEIDQLIQRLI